MNRFRIFDPSGAAMPGATILVENLDKNTSARLITNNTGDYESGFPFAVFSRYVARGKEVDCEFWLRTEYELGPNERYTG